MTDYYFKFDDRASMLAALEPLGMTYTPEEGDAQVIQGTHQYAANEVGEIAGVAGWHLNLRVIDEAFDVSSLDGYVVHPGSPKVIWA